jgi:prophage regulatory protein
MTIVYIKLPEVQRRTGKRKTQIYRDIKAGEFPKQVPNGKRGVAWIESEIEAWQVGNSNNRDAERYYKSIAGNNGSSNVLTTINDTFNFN